MPNVYVHSLTGTNEIHDVNGRSSGGIQHVLIPIYCGAKRHERAYVFLQN